MPLLHGQLALHDIQDAERFCRRILDNHLRKTRATLTPADYDDALTYLVETCWELSTRFDPSPQAGYTRGPSFSKYAYSILPRRVVEWYRTRFYRDQTNSDWYRRNNPHATPADPESLHRFHFPEPLDPDAHQAAEADHGSRDPLEFAVRARNGDLALDCCPALHDALTRPARPRARDLDVQGAPDDGRAARRTRRAA